MPFQKIEPERVSTTAQRQVEQLILRGILRPGERLPSERDLAEKFGISRPTVREAIGILEEKGLLNTRPGSGIYIADVLGSAFSPALIDLFARHEEALFDYLSLRRDLEGLAAARAATMASDTDLKVVEAVFQKMEAAHSKRNPDAESRLDADFHMSIVEASHNVVLLHMMRSMFQMLKTGVFYNRQVMFKARTTREALLDQHRTILECLLARDPKAARKAIEDHLDFVLSCMEQDKKAQANEAVARLRMMHEESR